MNIPQYKDHLVNTDDIDDSILRAKDSSKSSLNSDILTKIVKDNIDIFTPILHQEFNEIIFNKIILLTDLSKAFDCLSHDLLVAKLLAYGIEISFVRLIYDYLTNKKQRAKIGNNYSSWRNILSGVPQESILG